MTKQPKRGKFLKVTATIELDDGSRFEFLNANGETIDIGGPEQMDGHTLAIGMMMLQLATDQYFNDPRTPKVTLADKRRA